MKILPRLKPHIRGWTRSGFTLPEMMMSFWIFTFFLIGGVICIQIFALRIYTLAATKLSATQGSRKALNQIRDDIRQGKMIQVGHADNPANFTAYAGTNLAVGNALEVFSTSTLGPPYSLYYLSSNSVNGMSSNSLIWVAVTSNSSVSVNLVAFITNLDLFAAESWDNWPTNNSVSPTTVSNAIYNNQVYSVKMQFWQWQYPIAVVGGIGLNSYDYYQIRTRICRRATD